MIDKYPDRRSISLGFTDERFLEGQHICYLFNDDVERRRVMSKYMESGLLDHEKVLYLVDTMTPDEMLDCLEELGVDARSQPVEQLTVTECASAYCPRGAFVIKEMLDMWREFYTQAVGVEKYAGVRGAGEMSWSLVEGRVDLPHLMEYEAKLNHLMGECPFTVCCQYDTRRFDGNIIMDVMAVHPVMIVRGQLVKNPYYIGPEQFLRESRDRIAEQRT